MFFLMKDYQAIEPRYFKAFMAAAETENFTLASQWASMTQSGVSQHIAKLEEQVGLPLFKRIGKYVGLTETGEKLAKYIENHVYSVDDFLDSVHEHHERLTGLVSYAMPHSCLLSPHFPLLLEQRRLHPQLTLNINLVDSKEVTQLVLENKIDFGFITYKAEHPLLDLEVFCQEEYILVGADKPEIENFALEEVLNHSYIKYTGADIYYDYWINKFCSDQKKLSSYALTVAGNINSIDGAIKMACGGLGLGVFPRHCVAEFLESGVLHEYKTEDTLLNEIYIVKLQEHRYPIRIQQVIEWFYGMLN